MSRAKILSPKPCQEVAGFQQIGQVAEPRCPSFRSVHHFVHAYAGSWTFRRAHEDGQAIRPCGQFGEQGEVVSVVAAENSKVAPQMGRKSHQGSLLIETRDQRFQKTTTADDFQSKASANGCPARDRFQEIRLWVGG